MNGTLLHRIRRFCESQGIPESTFGRMAVRDPRLVGDISKGRELRPRTVARIRRFMEARS
jgi:16S rRNA U516 pseudouridylate synthase RsuA-like enzyme